MIIQIYEIEKDCFEDYIIMYPVCNGKNISAEDWRNKYGYAVTIKKTDLYDVMKDMDSWSCNRFGECCYFEFG